MTRARLLRRVAALERRPGIADPIVIVLKQFCDDGPGVADPTLTQQEEAELAEAKRRGLATFVIRRPVRHSQQQGPYPP